MPIRPSWSEGYWKRLDKETARRIRTTCPKCGSSNTYYNKQFDIWRCGRCEHSFIIKGYETKPWWKRLFRR